MYKRRKEHPNVEDTAPVATEGALLAQLQTATDSGLNDAETVEIERDEEFLDEEAARSPKGKSTESSVSKFQTMAQKHAEEKERVKTSADAKMRIRLRKMSRLEAAADQEAAKAADLAIKLEEVEQEAASTQFDLSAKLESTTKELVEVAQEKEFLQSKLAELTEELGRLQVNNQPSTDVASEDGDFQLPTPSPHNKHACVDSDS